MTVGVKKVFSNHGPKTAGDLLFDKFFYVEMETFSTISEEQLAVRGEFTSGDFRVDQQMSRRPSRVWRTINDLLALYHDGIDVNLVHGIKDVNAIHQIIQDHLHDCEIYHGRMGNALRREKTEVTRERLADLKSLDEFGRYLYNKARMHTKEAELVGIDKLLAETGDVVGANIPATDKRAIRNSPDYVGIEERINYSPLKSKKRYR